MEYIRTDDGRIWSYAQTPNQCGFAICELCGAAVPNLENIRKTHGEWHEKLRRAVDETETLG
jgi:hypothetical protein